jgi:Holliday junction resolvasome RuvABC DNA-binding subunit
MSDKKLIVSPEYPEGILLNLTAEEIAQREKDALKAEQDKQAELAKEEQEKARKESAIAKLKALGLTEEEVKSIL